MHRPKSFHPPLPFAPVALPCLALWLGASAQATSGREPPVVVDSIHVMMPAAPPAGERQRAEEVLRKGDDEEQAAVGSPPHVELPPAPLFRPPPPETNDALTNLAWYAGFTFLLVGVVGLIYRRMVFLYSLDSTPELPTEPSAEVPAELTAEPAGATRSRGLRPSDPRRRFEPAVPHEPAPDRLPEAALQALASLDGWITVVGLAQAVKTDDAAAERTLAALVEAGQVQEGRSQDGRTVYRLKG